MRRIAAADIAGELFGSGQLLDASKYFIVMPDNIGHGSHTIAALWKTYLAELLTQSER